MEKGKRKTEERNRGESDGRNPNRSFFVVFVPFVVLPPRGRSSYRQLTRLLVLTSAPRGRVA